MRKQMIQNKKQIATYSSIILETEMLQWHYNVRKDRDGKQYLKNLLDMLKLKRIRVILEWIVRLRIGMNT